MTKRSLETSSILEGLTFMLHCGRLQEPLWKKVIGENGGECMPTLKSYSKSMPETLTHIVVSTQTSEKGLLRSLHYEKLSTSVCVVLYQWVLDSIKSQQLKAVEQYLGLSSEYCNSTGRGSPAQDKKVAVLVLKL